MGSVNALNVLFHILGRTARLELPPAGANHAAGNFIDFLPEAYMQDLTNEQQILVAMRKTLAAIIWDVTPPPGMKHPLSTGTIEDVRQCLALISAREREWADQQGRVTERPYYTDEPQAAQVVSMAGLSKNRKPN